MDTKDTLLLFGGSFAPPHMGHIHALRAAMKVVKPTRVLIMPSGLSPHKRHFAAEETELRLELCRAAFSGMENVQISQYELQKHGYSYTADTLAHLETEYSRIWLLYGSDMFLKLGSWHRADEILSRASLVCMPRDEDGWERLMQKKDEYARAYGTVSVILNDKALCLSSTQIRERIAKGEELKDVLPEGVIRIIQRERLYQR